MKTLSINNKLSFEKNSVSELQVIEMNSINGGTNSILTEVGSSVVGNTYNK